MHLNKVLEAVNNIDDYAAASQNVDWKVIKIEKLQLNKSIVLDMKKIKTFEIEYFNKFGENGFACIAMTYILKQPSSKIWAGLGKELVNVLKYWLDALRKHLVYHNPIWWSFMEVLIKFIQMIGQKHSSIPDILVEQTAECLLDISTNDKSDECQRLQILQCLNLYCAESSREIRFAMRNKFSGYFVKLSSYMSTCGHVPCQFIIMETLLRWLVPRHNHAVRTSSANKWFPRELYSRRVVDIFLERSWNNFFEDARDFINTHNETNDLMLSLICQKLCVGNVEVISGTERMESWLDINSKGCCMSILLVPELLDRFRVQNHKACAVLIIKEENTSTVQLYRESRLITISVTTLSKPQVFPSAVKIDEGVRYLQFFVKCSSCCDLMKLDNALRKIYGDKYHLMMDLKREHTQSPQQTSQIDPRISRPDREVKFSQPLGKRRGRRQGYIVRSKNPSLYNSPSTTSTTSLAYLPERLAALPRFTYDKKSVRVCEPPNLTNVTEASETDERQTLNSETEIKLMTNRCPGVSPKSIRVSCSRSSQSDIEVKTNVTDNSLDQNDDPSISCLLIAAVGSTNDSVINSTIERLSKAKDYKPGNIVDLLIKEALQNDIGNSDTVLHRDTNINANEETQEIDKNTKANVNTVFTELEFNRGKENKKNCEVINTSLSTDDSNANIINETPVNCVTFRTKRLYRRTKPVEHVFNSDVLNKGHDAIANKKIKQNFMDISKSNIETSPTLAKKINETNLETNESFGHNINELSSQNVNTMLEDIEISECLNSIVDKVCNDLQKYTKYLSPNNKRVVEMNMISNHDEQRINFEVPSQNEKNKVSAVDLEQNKRKSKYSLQLKFPVALKNEKSIKTRSVTKYDQKKKDGNITNFTEHDIMFVNDELKNPPNRNTKATINRKKKNSTNFVDHTNNQANNARIHDTGKENITQTYESSILSERLPQENEPENNKTSAGALRRKRKLYSPILEQSNNELAIKQTSDIDGNMLMSNPKFKPKKLNYNATFYKDIEKERLNFIRPSRNLRSNAKVEESPRSKKLNQAFDKLKESENNDKEILLFDVNSANFDVYNFSSSEDDDFKRKKTYVRRRKSTTGSIESTLPTTDRMIAKRAKYTKNVSNTKKKSNKTTKSNKVSKVAKKGSNKLKVSIPTIDLVDERMRQSNTDVLNTSLVIEQPKNLANDHPVPVLRENPHLEDYNIHDKEIEKNEYMNTKSSETKLTVKKNKNLKRIRASSPNDGIESPLPELVVETTTMAEDDEKLSGIIKPDVIKSLKNNCMAPSDANINETNTSQNQLLGLEKKNQNEQSFNKEIQTVRIISNRDCLKISKNDTKPTKTDQKQNDLKTIEISNHNEQEIIMISECISEKSIATAGITAHVDFDESPPSMKYTSQEVLPRNLEIDDLDKSSQDYFNQLENRLNQSVENSQSPKLNTPIQHFNGSGTSFNKIPYVRISRLTFDDIKNVVNLDENSNKLSVKSGETSLIITPEIRSTLSDRRLLVSTDRSENPKKNIKTSGSTRINKNVDNSSPVYYTHKWLPSSRNSEGEFENNMGNLLNMSGSSKHSKSDINESSQEKRATAEKKGFPLAEVNKLKSKLISSMIDKLPHTNTYEIDSDKTAEFNINRRITRQTKLTEHKENTNIKKKPVISPVKKDLFTKNLSRPSQIIKEDIKEVRDLSQNLNTYSSVHATNSATRGTLTKSREPDTNRNILLEESSSVLSKPSSEVSKIILKRTAPVVDYLDKKIMCASPSASDRISIVNAWFEKNETVPDEGDDVTRLIMIDRLLDISEKLGTAYTEMNTNSNRRFVNMLVEVQRQSVKLDEERRTMYDEANKELLEKIGKLIHVMSVDLEHKSKAMTTDFMKEIKKIASEALLEDSRQRKSTTEMLKEYIKVVIDEIQKQRNA